MIQIVETRYFKDGRKESADKIYASKQQLWKAFTKSPWPSSYVYALRKHGEFTLDFADCEVHVALKEVDAES